MLDLNYKQGLEKLQDMVQQCQDPELRSEFGTLQIRLLECLEKEKLYGQSSNNDATGNEVIYRLTKFADEHFSILFLDLCRSRRMSSGQGGEYDTNTNHYQSKYTIKNSGPTQGQVVGEHVNVTMNFGSTQEECEPLLRSSSKPSPLPFETWSIGIEVTVRGVRYSIHEQPIEVKWAPDCSALYQRAKAQQIGTNRMVWLKQMQMRQVTQIAATWRTALEKESRLLDMLEQEQRQGFPRLVDFELETHVATLIYIATQGQSWQQSFGLSDEPLNAQLTRLLLQSAISLCEMLKILHKNDYVHRELTPGGILLLDKHRTVLQDIGLAACKYVPGEGPKGYQAPEQAKSNRSLASTGPYTDIYQLGVILYRLLTGRIPATGMPVLPPSTWNDALSSELDTVLLRAIVPDIKKRWRTSYDFSSVLRKALS